MRIRHWMAWGLLVLVVLGIGGAAFGFSAAGYEKYIVQTGSMVPELDPGDLVIDKPAAAGYEVGDVITFRHGQGSDLVTHRIIEITPNGIKTKGDANRAADVWTIPPELVQGVVAFNIPKGGYVVLFLSQPAGLGAIALVLVGLILLWRLFFPTETPHDETDRVDSSNGTDDDVSEDSMWAPTGLSHNNLLGGTEVAKVIADHPQEAAGRHHAATSDSGYSPIEQPSAAEPEL